MNVWRTRLRSSRRARLAAIARRTVVGQAMPFLDPPLRDEFGLAVAIWA
jgi:hypothetical protein